MKILIPLIGLFLLIGLLTSCVSGQYHVKINNDESVDINYQLIIDPSLLSLFQGEDPIKKAKAVLEKDGYTVINYTESNMVGFKAIKHIKNVKDFSFAGIMNFMSKSKNLTFQKGLFTKKYLFNSNIDLSSMKTSGENSEITNAMISRIKLKFLLTLPVKPKTTNASNITDNGKTMEWLLIPGKDNKIQVEAYSPNILNIIIASTFGLLILLSILYFVSLKRKKKPVEEKDEPISVIDSTDSIEEIDNTDKSNTAD